LEGAKMTLVEEIKRRIELKKQLITLTQVEIRALERAIKRAEDGKSEGKQ
jgi:hypothetical protein